MTDPVPLAPTTQEHDYAHGLARCSCGRIGLNHYPWEPSTRYSRQGAVRD